jgi:hypothetical protein
VTWNTLDAAIQRGAEFPVVRLPTGPTVTRRKVP